MTSFLYQRSLIMDVLASQESQYTYGASEKKPSGCPSAGGVLPVEMAASPRGGPAATPAACRSSQAAASPGRTSPPPAWSGALGTLRGGDRRCHGAEARAADLERLAVSRDCHALRRNHRVAAVS